MAEEYRDANNRPVREGFYILKHPLSKQEFPSFISPDEEGEWKVEDSEGGCKLYPANAKYYTPLENPEVHERRLRQGADFLKSKLEELAKQKQLKN